MIWDNEIKTQDIKPQLSIHSTHPPPSPSLFSPHATSPSPPTTPLHVTFPSLAYRDSHSQSPLTPPVRSKTPPHSTATHATYSSSPLPIVTNTSTTPNIPPSSPGTTLETLRKSYLRITSDLNRTTSHHNFITSCLSTHTIPIGLRIIKTCHAFKQSSTHVTENFNKIINQAQTALLEALDEHYRQLAIQLKNEKDYY